LNLEPSCWTWGLPFDHGTFLLQCTV
jgi:hypothetical protein